MAASRENAQIRRPWRIGITAATLGTGVLAALILAPGLTRKTDSEEINILFHGFQDSRGVTVLSPTIDLAKDFTDRTSLKFKFGVDAISASSDSCARCHPDGIRSGRAVASLGVDRKYGNTTVGIGGEFSQENFYRAVTVSTNASRTLNQANTTIAGGYSFSFNQPVLHPSEFAEKQYTHGGYVSVTQTLTRTTVAQLGAELAQIRGFQTSPYLRTSVNGFLTLGQSPDLRNRYTLTARIKQALPAATYIEADYRRYHDSWQVDSDSISVGVSHHFGDTLLAYGAFRKYNQTGAFFYAPSYSGSPEFFTGDFRLFPFDSNLVTGRVVYKPKDGVFGMRAGMSLLFQYERYWSNLNFSSAIFTGGVTIPFGHKTP
ncbi:MAG: DUF3570 domain-containing protein [Vicinamibacteria bacterium]|nr:DUF3570 domain-containing protein [Vicinamibacteria bacterium]